MVRASVRRASDCWASSGRTRAAVLSAIQSANDSLSQRSSHQAIVTRFPYHMWASSWAMTSAARFFSASVAVAGSSSSSVSRKKTAPAFSIAPASKSGAATRSSLA